MPTTIDTYPEQLYERVTITDEAEDIIERTKTQEVIDYLAGTHILLPQDAPAWAFSLLARQNAIITILEQLVGRGK
jgi:hypothetical protein